MKISICLDYSDHFFGNYFDFKRLQDVAEVLSKTGFTHINISSELSTFLISEGNNDYFNSLKKILSSNNLLVDWVHAPFFYTNLYTNDYSIWGASVAVIKKVIDIASLLNAVSVVVHPVQGKGEVVLNEESFDNLVKAFSILDLYAKEKKTIIAVENLIDNPVHFITTALLDKLPTLSLCFDAGHAAISDTLDLYLPKYINRVIALHIHDNDLKTDDHRFPEDGLVNFNTLFSILLKNNYKGVFGFETVQKKSKAKGNYTELANRIYNFLDKMVK